MLRPMLENEFLFELEKFIRGVLIIIGMNKYLHRDIGFKVSNNS